MGWKTRQFTFTVTGDDGVDDNLDAFIAGLNAAGYFFGAGSDEQVGPDGIDDAPITNFKIDNKADVTTPNFNPIEGVTYVLEKSENNWESISETIDGSCGPNTTYTDITYGANTRFRITAYDNTGTVPGRSSTPPV